MQHPDPYFDLDFSAINWTDYRGISQFEVIAAYRDAEKEWRTIKDPQTGERYYFIIGFGIKARISFCAFEESRQRF